MEDLLPQSARHKVLMYSDSEATLVPLCCALAKTQEWELIIAAPHPQSFAACMQTLQKQFPAQKFTVMGIKDKAQAWLDALQSHQPLVVMILTPVTEQSLTMIATHCVKMKVHCMDTSDEPNRLSCLELLQDKAKAQNVSVICGVNQVPGLSSTVIDTYAAKFATLREVYCSISVSQLSKHAATSHVEMTEGLGEPFQRLEGGVWNTVYGWQNLHRYYYGDNIGYRWQSSRNIPDITLFPKRYPELKSMVFHTGVDNVFIHWILWCFSWLRRIRVVPPISWLNQFMGWCEKRLRRKKLHRHGMVIRMVGASPEYQPLEIKWSLVAEETGQDELKAIICQCVLHNLQQGEIAPGVQACLGLFTLSQFDEKLSSKVYHTIEETAM